MKTLFWSLLCARAMLGLPAVSPAAEAPLSVRTITCTIVAIRGNTIRIDRPARSEAVYGRPDKISAAGSVVQSSLPIIAAHGTVLEKNAVRDTRPEGQRTQITAVCLHPKSEGATVAADNQFEGQVRLPAPQ